MAPEDADALAIERHRRLCAAFDRLFPLDAVARADALARLPEAERDLHDDLAGMLAASASPGLDVRAPEPPALDDPGDDRGWRVLRELGRGGMGRVLLAERADGRFTKQVAIKVLDRSPDDPDWRRRFNAEREILARLVHPGIVRLLDAGETRAGVPYLVMEYVAGEALDRYLERRRPDLATRLDLFAQVASSVAHAHRAFVAHRDLKPGNILVDDQGRTHLLDFGIARLMSDAVATATGARALTPRYAAPEQVAGKPGTTALDIYQLGVLLHELLAGTPPFADREGPALLRAVLEEDPKPPSQLPRHVPGVDADLDAICLKSLRKEPGQRYDSVDAMLADIERWRRREPVLAHAGGAVYRARKFVQRHWRAMSVVAVLVAIVAGFVWRLDRELERSERERRVAEQATELMVDVIGRADPSRAQGEELTLREALGQSVERLRQTSDLAPIVRARVLESVGATYVELSNDAEALPVLAESAAAFAAAGDADGEQRALHARGVAIMNLGNYAAAQKVLEDVLAKRTRAGLRGDAFEAELHGTIGILHQYQREPARALAAFDEALRIQRAMAEPDEAQLLHTLRNLGEIRTSQGDLEGGQAALAEARAIADRILGPDHPDSIRLLRGMGRNALRRGAIDEGLRWLEEGFARAQRVFQPPHTVRLLLGHPLALARLEHGDLESARTLMRQMRAESAEAFPPKHPSTATIAADLSLLELLAGDDALARPLAEEALETRQALEDTDSSIAQPALVLAVLDCHASKATADDVAKALARVVSDPLLPQGLKTTLERAAAGCDPR